MGAGLLAELNPLRVVLDTNTILSALLFPEGRLAWIRAAWTIVRILPLVCTATVRELIRALGYPKFALTEHDVRVCLSAYLPFTEPIDLNESAVVEVPICRDRDDQVFLHLAAVGEAVVLVTGDAALLELDERVPFAIERPASFKKRFE